MKLDSFKSSVGGQIIIGAIGSAVCSFAIAWFQINSVVPTWVFVASVTFVAATVFTLSRWYSNPATIGRENAGQVNVSLMRERTRIDATTRKICSTRVSLWPSNESSAMRTSFRNELSLAVLDEGCEVRRLWNITSPADADRLLDVLKLYKDKPNFSVHILFDVSRRLIPEILVVNEHVASISLPQPVNPRSLVGCIVVRDRTGIKLLQGYFDVLWDASEWLTKGGKVSLDALAKVKTYALKGSL